ncbi:MAG: ABC transporter permease [Methanomassiliicoccales archaeon]
MAARAYPRIIGKVRAPSWMVTDMILPLLGVAAFVYYYRSMGAPEVFTGFVILGGAMMAYWLNVLWGMAAQFYWEREVGNLQLYMITPMSRMSLLAGMALGGMFSTTMRAVSTFILGFVVFGVEVVIRHPGQLILVFLLTLVALYGMGMLFSSLYLMFGRNAWRLSMLAQEPIYLLSGFYFPVRSLGFWISAAASAIPMTLGLDAMRQLIFTGGTNPFLSVPAEILLLVVLSVVFILSARYALRYMEYRGKREGRLLTRWQ